MSGLSYFWHLCPPARVTGEYFDFHNNNMGNPTAFLLLMWDNGKTGTDWAGGSSRSTRREWYGYANTAAEVGLSRLAEMWPGTRWKLDPDQETDDPRHIFHAVRDYEAEPVPVIFRAERSGPHKGEVTAVFPTLPGTSANDVTVYGQVGQHSTGTRGWYRGTRPATEEESAALKKELESEPFRYVLEPVKRWTATHDAKRGIAYNATRGAAA